MDRIVKMHGAPLQFPQYDGDFYDLTEMTRFRGFCRDVTVLNGRGTMVSRPVMEEMWALTCRIKAEEAYPVEVRTNPTAMREMEVALFSSFSQMEESAGFNINMYWAQRRTVALNLGIALDITSTFDMNRAFAPEGRILQKEFSAEDEVEQKGLLTASRVQHKEVEELAEDCVKSNLDDARGCREMEDGNKVEAGLEIAPVKRPARFIDEDYDAED
ncbi:hypothetical protein BJ875DRAFT_457992 [Amylocarpus encephaloides]|uniref:Uncharacterized protein n=1 Tax=Amylocarpus encephaloides TaxID=45428 RepID=A0A9P8C6Q4_9HELO|nr:hypothetical protein BJ875DRAFT_457992 [Amylocarpus encephaloides]